MSMLPKEQMQELFIFETTQLLDQLEQIMMSSEQTNSFSAEQINETFRIMHTIKGSAAMMRYDNISKLAHFMEDLFYFIREHKSLRFDFSELADLILKGADFIKVEFNKIKAGRAPNADAAELISGIGILLADLKQTSFAGKQGDVKDKEKLTRQELSAENMEANTAGKVYRAVIHFEEDCEMLRARAYMVVTKLKDLAEKISYLPANINEDEKAEEVIRENGFEITFTTDCPVETVREMLQQTVYLKQLEVEVLNFNGKQETQKAKQVVNPITKDEAQRTQPTTFAQSMISVNISKLDKLMDLVGELVISESMVTQNSDLLGLSLENFSKATRQHRKIINELQDTVMSIRMVPLAPTFQKMNRIIRDMSKQLHKNIQFEIIGEETEVDKNIIEHISDPLIHIIRNSVDHGIESAVQRVASGKDETGKVTLEAKNAGGDVIITVKDDGKGLDRGKILEKAKKNGLLKKPESELSDQQIYSCIFFPGFSTKEKVSQFSGRGVGMDVVTKNLEQIGGTVNVDSIPEKGTVVNIKIPLTLAIIDGMNIKVGNCRYTIPTIAIREIFKPEGNKIIQDPKGNEMLMLRGQCYPILRLHQFYNVKTEIVKLQEGIIIVVENNAKVRCIFVDALLGEQQVVIKALPEYLKKVKGLSGCTLLGGGEISLMLDPAALVSDG